MVVNRFAGRTTTPSSLARRNNLIASTCNERQTGELGWKGHQYFSEPRHCLIESFTADSTSNEKAAFGVE
jgi:hypothetical protein